ncbi:hypothetical protein IID62_11500 [candidate division KSB1 bacterium]|nr:hypothetical protein [candidate division KSB1 bacterium]
MAITSINPKSTVQNSNTTFGILNQAQQKENELVEKVAKIAITEKLQADKNAILGQVIDMLV